MTFLTRVFKETKKKSFFATKFQINIHTDTDTYFVIKMSTLIFSEIV